MNQADSVKGRNLFEDFPKDACLSRGFPGADAKSELFNLFIKTQKENPSLRWNFEIQGTTALHEIVENSYKNLFLPSQSYWLHRIVKEGGATVVNSKRSCDLATPLHLAKSASVVKYLLSSGADPYLLNNAKKSALQKIICSPKMLLDERTSIYKVFSQYCPQLPPWNTHDIKYELIERVENQITKDKKKWSFLLLNFSDENWNCTLAWLPRELRIEIAILGYFLF